MTKPKPNRNQIRNALVLRVFAGELTRDEADLESTRLGAGRIYNHSPSSKNADSARAVWRDTFGKDEHLGDAETKELGEALGFLQGLADADRLHTPKGAERAALARLQLIVKLEDRVTGDLVSRNATRRKKRIVLQDNLAVRLLCRNADILSIVEKINDLKSAAKKAIKQLPEK
jgi:hypothetical protein